MPAIVILAAEVVACSFIQATQNSEFMEFILSTLRFSPSITHSV